jgi:hypothetical protein
MRTQIAFQQYLESGNRLNVQDQMQGQPAQKVSLQTSFPVGFRNAVNHNIYILVAVFEGHMQGEFAHISITAWSCWSE